MDSADAGAMPPASSFYPLGHHRTPMQTVSPPPYQDRISPMPTVDSSRMANAIRALAMDAVEKAKSGHPGLPMGMADVATVLFTRFLKYDAADPHWPDRDRFILSAGHGSMLLYSLLYLTGYEDMTIDEIKQLPPARLARRRAIPNTSCRRHRDDHRPARPGHRHFGRLGARRAHAGRRVRQRPRRPLHLCARSRRRLMEGISQEAIALAGHLKLNKLIVFWDDNDISIDGPISLADYDRPGGALPGLRLERQPDRRPRSGSDRRCHRSRAHIPTSRRMIACKTTIGFGAPTKAGTYKAHGDAARRRRDSPARSKSLGWDFAALRDSRRHPRRLARAPARAAQARAARVAGRASLRRPSASAGRIRAPHRRQAAGQFSTPSIADYKKKLVAEQPTVATRKASEMALEVIIAGGARDRSPAPPT